MRFDLHTHSVHSPDGRNNVADMIRILKEKGFSGAAFTDHNSPGGGLEALSLDEKDFIVIPGIEVSSAEGHIIALNVKEPVPRDLSVKETIEFIHAQGGIAVAAHPYRFWSGLGENNVLGQPFDAIESFNGRSVRRSNEKAVKLATRMQLGITGGSDSHENYTLGDAYTVVPDDCDTVEKVLKAIVERRTETGGRHRTVKHTIQYVIKAVSEWIGRGMRRM